MITLKGLKKLQGYNGLRETMFCVDGRTPVLKTLGVCQDNQEFRSIDF